MSEKVTEFFQKNWPMIVGALVFAAAWGTSTAQIAGIADTSKTILSKLDTVAERGVAATTDIGNAKRDIDDIRTRVHTLEARR